MADYSLSLMCGTDIPIPEIQAAVHQPQIKEIAFMGERNFYIAAQCLGLQKTMFSSDKSVLSQITNFQIFMMVMNEKEASDKKELVIQLLGILFPSYKVLMLPTSIILTAGDITVIIDENNFEILQRVLMRIFCLENTGEDIYNPANEEARRIAERLMRARKIVAEQRAAMDGESSEGALARFISILTIGPGSMSLNECASLTIYQLQDLVQRYNLYLNWDIDLRSRLMGGTPEKPAENWMKNIHDKS